MSNDLLQSNRVRLFFVILVCSVLAGITALFFIDPIFVFVAVVVLGVVLLFARYETIPLVLIAATFPFIYLEIRYGELNVPVVDVVGILAFLAFVIRFATLCVHTPGHWKTMRLPGVWFFLAFFIVALISTRTALEPALSLKYVFRPILFFYVVYIVTTVNMLNTTRRLKTIFWTMYTVGVMIAVYGAVGFFLSESSSLVERRVVPVSIGGVYPLGGNHNLIADVMVTIVPIGIFLAVRARTVLNRRLAILGTIMMGAIGLLTFSRSAWLALGVELFILLFLRYRHRLKELFRSLVLFALVALPLMGYMVFFSQQDIVDASTQNRLLLGDISIEMFRESLFFGAGPGTFMEYVEQNSIYMKEFGSPLDAHGFLYKVGSELGLLGLAAFCSLLVSILWILYRRYREASFHSEWSLLCLVVLILSAGSIFFQLFQTSYYVAKLWFPLGVALAVAYLPEQKQL